MNCYTSLFLVLTLLITTSLSGEVIFNLNFTDPEGVGFHAPENKERMDQVREGAALLGKIIKQNAVVTVEVKSDETKTTSAAYAIPRMDLFLQVKLQRGGPVATISINQILNEATTLSDELDVGIIGFNLNSSLTLQITTIHELTHILGFSSYFLSGRYTEFDQLIHDGNNNPVIIEDTGWLWNSFKINPEVNLSSDLYVCGSNIRKHNNGDCLKLYNPKIYKRGSSHDHLDTDTYPKNILNHIGETHPIWNSYEIGIMKDLGYEIDWDNYCKIIQDYFPSTKFIINVNAEQLKDIHFELVHHAPKDFPTECFPAITNTSELYESSFSAFFMPGDELRLVSDDQVIYVRDLFNVIEELDKSAMRVKEDIERIGRVPNNDMLYYMVRKLQDLSTLNFRVSGY